MGEKSAQSIVDFMSDEDNQKLIETIQKEMPQLNENIS